MLPVNVCSTDRLGTYLTRRLAAKIWEWLLTACFMSRFNSRLLPRTRAVTGRICFLPAHWLIKVNRVTLLNLSYAINIMGDRLHVHGVV